MTNLLVRWFVKDYKDTTNTAVRTAYGRLAGITGIVCNLLLFTAKLVIGTLSGSISITADAFNNLSDASSSIITLLGFKLSARPADKDHPFGHARYEYIAALAVSVLIMVIGLELAKSSLDKILHPAAVQVSGVLVAVLCLSMAVKLWMMLFNKKLGGRIQSAVLQATAADSRNDIVATGVVLAGALLSHFTQLMLDGWFGMMVAAFILVSGALSLRETLSLLLGERPDPALAKRIAEKILQYDGVLGTHDLIVHDYGPGHRFASAHVEMDAKVSALISHDIIDNIERDFKQQEKLDLVIHYDPVVVGEEAVGTMRQWIKDVVRGISPQLSMHDFRMVQGADHTNLIFDVVVPQDFALTHEQIEQKINLALQMPETRYYTVITFDDSYADAPNTETPADKKPKKPKKKKAAGK